MTDGTEGDRLTKANEDGVEVHVVRTTWPLYVLVALLAVVGFAGLVEATKTTVAIYAVTGIGLAAGAWALAQWRSRSGPALRGRLTARGIEVGERVLLRRADIVSAYFDPEPNRPEVHVESRHLLGARRLRVADEESGKALLHALGQDPARARVRFRVRAGFEQRWARTIVSVVLAMTWSFSGVLSSVLHHHTHVAYALLALFGLVLASTWLPTFITVGADGLFIERFGRRRYVPFSLVRAVERHAQHDDAIVLRLAEGREIVLRTKPGDRAGVTDVTPRAVRARIEDAFAAFQARSAVDALPAMLARGERSAAAWLEELRGVAAREGYRVAQVPEEALWRVVEDPAASGEARAAALVSLRGRLDDEGRARVRAVVDGCAAPRLRVALDAATKENDAELEAALDALAEEESGAAGA